MTPMPALLLLLQYCYCCDSAGDTIIIILVQLTRGADDLLVGEVVSELLEGRLGCTTLETPRQHAVSQVYFR